MSKHRKKQPSCEPRQLFLKEDDNEYGLVTKKLGSGRFLLRLNLQTKEVIGRLCGKFRHGSAKRSNWVDVGTIVLVGLRDFQDTIVDIVHVYDDSEARTLKRQGHIIFDTDHLANEDAPPNDETFVFEDI